MSHLVSVSVAVTDIESVRLACDELSKRLGKKITLSKADTYAWFGYSVGDYPLPEGFTKDDLGKCEYKINVEGCGYEIGLAKARNGKPGWTMLFDFWGSGRGLLDVLCTETEAEAIRSGATKSCTAGQFMKTYSCNFAERQGKKLGFNTRREVNNGKLSVVYTGRF